MFTQCSVNLSHFKFNITNRIGNTLPLNPEILCLKNVPERLYLYLDELEIARLYLGLELAYFVSLFKTLINF